MFFLPGPARAVLSPAIQPAGHPAQGPPPHQPSLWQASDWNSYLKYGLEYDCPIFHGLFDFCRLYAGASIGAQQAHLGPGAGTAWARELRWAGGWGVCPSMAPGELVLSSRGLACIFEPCRVAS